MPLRQCLIQHVLPKGKSRLETLPIQILPGFVSTLAGGSRNNREAAALAVAIATYDTAHWPLLAKQHLPQHHAAYEASSNSSNLFREPSCKLFRQAISHIKHSAIATLQVFGNPVGLGICPACQHECFHGVPRIARDRAGSSWSSSRMKSTR